MTLPWGFRAIDMCRLCVAEPPRSPTPSFAALSYTWGPLSGIKELQLEQVNFNLLQREGSLERTSGIPDLILDAIKLCNDLGERYLWVDRRSVSGHIHPYLSELRRDFLASVGITYAVFRIAKSRLRHFGEFC